jgi:hypothetical protein
MFTLTSTLGKKKKLCGEGDLNCILLLYQNLCLFVLHYMKKIIPGGRCQFELEG